MERLCEHCSEPFVPRREGQRFCSRSCGVTAAHSVRHAMTRPWQERFWDHVPDRPDDGCWLWSGTLGAGGYGRLMTVKPSTMPAHRASYEIHSGPLPAGVKVCHTCDTPRCVRPDHLFAGTQAENIADMYAKGRGNTLRNEASNLTRHPDTTVAEIRRLLAEGMTQTPIARQLGVSVSMVKHIRAGRTRRI